MSKTPRTDEQALIDAVSYDGHSQDYVSLLNYARELERELNGLQKDKARLDWLLNNKMVNGKWDTYQDDARIKYQLIYATREHIDLSMEGNE